MLYDALRNPATPRRIVRRTLALAVASTLLVAPLALAPASPAFAQARPTNLADLVDAVSEAVVNISATQTVDDKDGGAAPDLPKGTPFDEMFEEFFKNHGINPQPRARRAQSLGSGFVIDPSGVVITNNHVIGDANDIVVIFTDGRKLKATVVGKDAKVDVAVLKVESDKPLKTVKLRRQRQDAGRRRRHGGRQSVRPRRNGDGRHHFRPQPQHRQRPLRRLSADRRLDQQGQFGRTAVQSAGRGDRHQHRHPVAFRGFDRHRLRDPVGDRRSGDRAAAANSTRPGAAGSAFASSRSTTPSPTA